MTTSALIAIGLAAVLRGFISTALRRYKERKRERSGESGLR